MIQKICVFMLRKRQKTCLKTNSLLTHQITLRLCSEPVVLILSGFSPLRETHIRFASI